MNHFKEIDNSKIGVLGLGYIGTNIIDFLKENYPLSDVIGINRKNLDINEDTSFDYFINCAGNSGDFRENIKGTIDSNVNLTLYLMSHLSVSRKLVYLSSTRVYGFSENKNTLFTEDTLFSSDHLDLNYIYDGTKKLCESIISNNERMKHKYGIVRLSNVYGNFTNLNDATLIKKIVRCAKEKTKNKLVINQSSKSEKDYIHIKDAIDGIIRVMVYIGKERVFNIARGESYPQEDLAKGTDLSLVFNNIDPIYSHISIERAKKELGFAPVIPFDINND